MNGCSHASHLRSLPFWPGHRKNKLLHLVERRVEWSLRTGKCKSLAKALGMLSLTARHVSWSWSWRISSHDLLSQRHRHLKCAGRCQRNSQWKLLAGQANLAANCLPPQRVSTCVPLGNLPSHSLYSKHEVQIWLKARPDLIDPHAAHDS